MVATEYIGGEEEFMFSPDNPNLNSELNTEFMKKMMSGEKHFYDGLNKDSRVWLEDACFYVDVFSAEGNTLPIQLGAGCAKELADAIMKNRARVAEYGGPAQIRTTHYNIGFENPAHQDEIARLSMVAMGPVYKTLLRNSGRRIKQGTWKYRAKPGRTEFCAHSVMDTGQLEAGIAFLVGTVKGLERLLDEEAGGDVKKAYSMLPFTVKEPMGVDVETDILENGLDAIVVTNGGEKKGVGELFKAYMKLFERDIEKIATHDELATLRKFASGEKKPEGRAKECRVDREYIMAATEKNPKEVIAENRESRGPPGLAGDAVNFAIGKEIGNGLKRKTRLISWDAVLFNYSDLPSGKQFDLAIPSKDAKDYMKIESSQPEMLIEKGRDRGWLVNERLMPEGAGKIPSCVDVMNEHPGG